MWMPDSEGAQPPQSSATGDIMGEDEEDLFAAYDYGFQLNVQRLFNNNTLFMPASFYLIVPN